jgi:1,4-alpha-glucan branching enzyme
VGNADRTINTAMNHEQGRIPGQWERNAAKLTFGLGMLSPGLPIYFQGEESLATNQFKWGRPSTWDVGWDWKEVGKDWDWNKISMNDGKADYLRGVMNENDGALREKKLETMSDTDKKVLEFLESKAPEDREEAIFNVMRRQHNTFCAEATKLRAGNAAFDGDAEVHRVYSHNEDSVMAFTRKKGSEEFLVVGSFNHENKGDYNIPLSGGKWHLVFNSDAGMFGGNNYGSKIDVYGNQGSRFDIPKGGLLVYKKVE